MTDPGTKALAGGILREVARGEPSGAHLRVLDGPLAGERLALGPEETLGRGGEASLRLPDPEASRRHARLDRGPEGVRLEDLGSKNGLRLNGRRLRSPARLRPGDLLTVGGTRLAFEDPESRPPSAPAPAPAPGPAPRVRRRAAALLLLGAAAALLLAAAG